MSSLTLVLSGLVSAQTGSRGEELEADVTLEQVLQRLALVCKDVWVVGAIVVPQARQLLQRDKKPLDGNDPENTEIWRKTS